MTRNRIPRIAGALLALAWAAAAGAQGYPAKPVRVIVPIAPGGGQDFVARMVGQKLTAAFGQQFIIDNRPGAGGIIGTQLAVKSPPDGYTLVLVAASYTAQPSLYSKLPYDAVKDLAPITQLGGAPYLLVVNPTVPAKSVREFVALAKSSRGKLTYGSSGSGEMSNLSMELLKTLAGFDAVHVPYKGAAPALAAAISGEVDAFFPSITSGMPHVRSGKARVLAVTTAKRAALLPEVPTIAESGFPGYDVSGWYGLLAPAGTPNEIVNRLQQEVAKILDLPDVRDMQTANGRVPTPGGNTPQSFAANIQAEIARWAKVIKRAGIRLE
ncbi:MAG TPA: tripartite tricarboxylate transporter substrate binding protein [Burkholderiales bacterium]|nr:tripartite tricarboxylate transporter substrate binding protein [Burkholderiales bacterium]